jgi:hypothetical protein
VSIAWCFAPGPPIGGTWQLAFRGASLLLPRVGKLLTSFRGASLLLPRVGKLLTSFRGASPPGPPIGGTEAGSPKPPPARNARCKINVGGGCLSQLSKKMWHDNVLSMCHNISCRGSGGALRTQRGARGAEPPRMLSCVNMLTEREGPGTHTQRVPGVASHGLGGLIKCREREGQSLLACLSRIIEYAVGVRGEAPPRKALPDMWYDRPPSR